MPAVTAHRANSFIRAGCVLIWVLSGCGASDSQPRPPSTVEFPIGAAGAPGAILTSPGCPLGQQSCAGTCVDVATNPNHCGVCGMVCLPSSTCIAGSCACSPGQMLCNGACMDPQACTCPSGWMFCNGMCVDVLSEAGNCGACGHACAANEVCDVGTCRPADSNSCTDTCGGGRECQAGTCMCPSGQQFCEGACVDTQESDQNCSACGMACSGGEVCNAGACACPTGQMDCNGQCADLQTSLMNCGMCGHACMQGDACTAGRCAGPTGDDGCSGEALGVTLAQVAAYQSIKIPIVDKQQAVATSARVADVVQGRDTMFRVFVDVDSGFGARELSARLTLSSAGDSTTYFAKQMVKASSTDADTSSSFQIFVPADAIAADTRYAVELVECTMSATGTTHTPRFPASSDSPLDARQTGVLKIAIVPVISNSITPDTSDTVLEVYRKYLMAMYPATEVQLSVVDPINTSVPISWSSTLDQVRQKRQQDAPPTDVYYFGFLKPAATLREYCRGGCTAGVGFVGDVRSGDSRVAIGLAFGDENSAAIMAHEVGHNHGRNHAPCAPGGQISGVDPNYPYNGALIGTWGYDGRSRTLFDPAKSTDIMGYCDSKWVSDYTYRGFVDRVAAINGAPLEITAPDMIANWQVMLIDSVGPRWGLPFKAPRAAFGAAELAEVLDENGQLLDYTTVYRTEISDIGSASVLVREPRPGWTFVRVQGSPALAFSEPISVPEP